MKRETPTTTPTFSGTAGISPGDSSTVTLNIYQSAPLIKTIAIPVEPYDGILDQDTSGNWSLSNIIDLTMPSTLTAPTNLNGTSSYNSSTGVTTYSLGWTPTLTSSDQCYILYDVGVNSCNSAHTLQTNITYSTSSLTFTSTTATGHFALAVSDGTNYSLSNAIDISAPTTSTASAPSPFTAKYANGGVYLAWNNNSSMENGFELQRKIAGGNWQTIANPAVLIKDRTSYSVTRRASPPAKQFGGMGLMGIVTHGVGTPNGHRVAMRWSMTGSGAGRDSVAGIALAGVGGGIEVGGRF